VTVAELIVRLRELPPELPVYFRDTDGDWLPCRPVDVQSKHFHWMGEVINRPGGWYILVDGEANPVNGVGIG
jgi:hypothetical protein